MTDSQSLLSPISSPSALDNVHVDRLNEQLKATEHHFSAQELANLSPEQLSSLPDSKLKWLCRDGLTHDVRRMVWMKVTGAESYQQRNLKLYDRTFEEVFHDNKSIEDFPVIPFLGHSKRFDMHGLTVGGTKSLQRILVLLVHLNVELDFCPFLGDLIAVSLSYMDEKSTFYLLQQVVNRSRVEEWYLPLTGVHFAIFVETFRYLLEIHLETLYKHIEQNKLWPGVAGILKDWFSRGFVEHLPRYSFLRTLDSWFYEGAKIHYRVGLAIFKTHQDELLATPTDNFLTLLGHLSRKSHNATQLLETAFNFSLSRRDFIRIQADEDIHKNIHRLDVRTERPINLWPKFQKGDSDVFRSVRQCMQLWSWLPRQLHLGQFYKCFSFESHGHSLRTLLSESLERGPVIIIVRDVNDFVFGFGTGDDLIGGHAPVVDRRSFLFSFHPVTDADLQQDQNAGSNHYKWHHSEPDNDIFYLFTESGFTVSASGSVVFRLTKDLEFGSTDASKAYRNDPLTKVHEADGSFKIASVEVWAFDHMSKRELPESMVAPKPKIAFSTTPSGAPKLAPLDMSTTPPRSLRARSAEY